MSLETKRIKELFGYARTLTKEQGVGVMAGRAVGFFKRRFFGKKARYLPSKQTLETQRADAAARADGWPTISILTPLYNTPPQFLQQFLDSVQAQTAPNWQLVLVDASRTSASSTPKSRTRALPPIRTRPRSSQRVSIWLLPTTTTCSRLMPSIA